MKSPEQPAAAVALTTPGVMETSVDASHEDNNPETDVATDHQIPTEVGFMLEQGGQGGDMCMYSIRYEK